MPSDTLHVDIVKNEWLIARQIRVGVVRVEVLDDRYEHLRETHLQELANRNGGGSYVFDTDPHSDQDCPFRDNNSLPMVPTTIEAIAGGDSPLGWPG